MPTTLPATAAAPAAATAPAPSENDRIAILTDAFSRISRTTGAREALELYIAAMRRILGARAYVSLSVKGLAPDQYRVMRARTVDGRDLISAADLSLAPDGAQPPDPAHHPVRSGGFLSTIIATPEPKVIHDLSIPSDPAIGDLFSVRGSLVAVPVFDDGAVADWTLLFREGQDAAAHTNLEFDVMRVNLLASAIRSIDTASRLREATAQINREVDTIAEIQRTLLPPRNPRIPGLTIATHYETFDRAGGDYYDFLPLREGPAGARDLAGPWGLLIADASGHGPAAAVVTAMLHTIVQAPGFNFTSPSEALEHLNRRLYARPIGQSFVTAFFGVWDPETRRLTYSRAGHNPPLLKTRGAGGAVRRLDRAGGLPLGVAEEVGCGEEVVALTSDQTLVLYTDGVTEAKNESGRMFGTEGIERALIACSGETACIVGSVREALRAHETGGRPSDDQTIVAVGVV